MPNVYDYLSARGELSFEENELNKIDQLIFSRISYLPFDNIVPSSFQQSITIQEANEALQQKGDEANYILQADRALLPALAASSRFSSTLLSGFVNNIDPAEQMQFSAMVIKPGEGSTYISYRGTDDTLVGWKEDFNLSFMDKIPAQVKAVEYFETAAAELESEFILVGHSKGGNLAVYAAAHCAPQLCERIKAVYNFDGPGQHAVTVNAASYATVSERIHTIVPQSSVIGLLLEHPSDYSIILSKQKGYMQHDLYSWEVEGDDFIYLDQISSSSRFMDKTLRNWVDSLSIQDRSNFIEGLYMVLNSSNSANFREITSKKWYEYALASIKALINLDEPIRKALGMALWSLAKAGKENLHIFLSDFAAQKKENGTAAKKDKPDES